MRPIEKHESAKVVSAARQSIESRPMAIRLMHRIRMTDDALVQQEMMRMHGFSMMHTVLIDFESDNEILAEVGSRSSAGELMADPALSPRLEAVIQEQGGRFANYLARCQAHRLGR